MSYKLNENQLQFTIYLENAPYHKELLEQAGWDKQTLCNLEWYVIAEDFVTLVSFDNNYVYVVSAESLDTLTALLKGN